MRSCDEFLDTFGGVFQGIVYGVVTLFLLPLIPLYLLGVIMRNFFDERRGGW